MPKLNPEVTAYIASQPEAAQPALNDLRRMIRAAYPRASEEMYLVAASGQTFPIYKDGEVWLGGFANRAVGPRLYIDQTVVEKYREQLGRLVQGKGCLLYKPTKTLDQTALKKLFETMLKEAAAKNK
jgi:uncharacterized protein YdhG (YjbR/CyaY superfamily)